MDKESFEKHRPYAGPAKPSMHRRRIDHDYRSRCVYLVTMTVEGRRPLLGRLVGNADAPAGSADAPRIALSPLGEAVRQAWLNNGRVYEGVDVLATMVMPDHLHGILFFREQSKVDLGAVIRGFKAACNKAYRQLLPQLLPPHQPLHQPPHGGGIDQHPAAAFSSASASAASAAAMSAAAAPASAMSASAMSAAAMSAAPSSASLSLHADTPCQPYQKQPPRDRTRGLLWSPNYNDLILEGHGELGRWFEYLRDNPRRLAVRRAHREYFRVQFDLTVAGRTYSAIGNRFLLHRPQKLAVKCSRSLTAQQVAAEVNRLLTLARKGVILISPSISDGEKAVMETALAEELPLVFLSPRGFNEYSRPGHRYYDACAEGRFLILAPWPHNNRDTPLTRQMCLELNKMAEEIAAYVPSSSVPQTPEPTTARDDA